MYCVIVVTIPQIPTTPEKLSKVRETELKIITFIIYFSCCFSIESSFSFYFLLSFPVHISVVLERLRDLKLKFKFMTFVHFITKKWYVV